MTETNSIEADEGKLQAMLRTLVNQLVVPELYLLISTILPRIRCDSTIPEANDRAPRHYEGTKHKNSRTTRTLRLPALTLLLL